MGAITISDEPARAAHGSSASSTRQGANASKGNAWWSSLPTEETFDDYMHQQYVDANFDTTFPPDERFGTPAPKGMVVTLFRVALQLCHDLETNTKGQAYGDNSSVWKRGWFLCVATRLR